MIGSYVPDFINLVGALISVVGFLYVTYDLLKRERLRLLTRFLVFMGPHMKVTGQVKNMRQISYSLPANELVSRRDALNVAYMFQNGKLFGASDSFAEIPLSQSKVTLQLPQGSFPPNDVLTLIANNFQFKVGDFITVVATPNKDGTFTARQITKTSMSAFQNQVIEYQGTATASVTCQTTCAGQPISFVIGGTNFSFTMSSDTTVTGFGSPPTNRRQFNIRFHRGT